MRVLILILNIKYVGGKYRDFFGHITPVTKNALIGVAEAVGFRTARMVKKFLPFTTKSRLPHAP